MIPKTTLINALKYALRQKQAAMYKESGSGSTVSSFFGNLFSAGNNKGTKEIKTSVVSNNPYTDTIMPVVGNVDDRISNSKGYIPAFDNNYAYNDLDSLPSRIDSNTKKLLKTIRKHPYYTDLQKGVFNKEQVSDFNNNLDQFYKSLPELQHGGGEYLEGRLPLLEHLSNIYSIPSKEYNKRSKKLGLPEVPTATNPYTRLLLSQNIRSALKAVDHDRNTVGSLVANLNSMPLSKDEKAALKEINKSDTFDLSQFNNNLKYVKFDRNSFNKNDYKDTGNNSFYLTKEEKQRENEIDTKPVMGTSIQKIVESCQKPDSFKKVNKQAVETIMNDLYSRLNGNSSKYYKGLTYEEAFSAYLNLSRALNTQPETNKWNINRI